MSGHTFASCCVPALAAVRSYPGSFLVLAEVLDAKAAGELRVDDDGNEANTIDYIWFLPQFGRTPRQRFFPNLGGYRILIMATYRIVPGFLLLVVSVQARSLRRYSRAPLPRTGSSKFARRTLL